MATSIEEENPSAIPDASKDKDEPSFVTDDEESSEEEEQQEEIENGGEVDDNDDDGYALLALTKRRIQEQKEKEAEEVSPANDDEEEQEEGQEGEGVQKEQEGDDAAEDGGVVNESEPGENNGKVSATDNEISSSPSASSKDEEKKEDSSGEEGGAEKKSNSVASQQSLRKSPEIPEGTHQANAELWALLNQSKKRLGGKAAILSMDGPPKSPSRASSGGTAASAQGSPGRAPSAAAPKTQDELLKQVVEKKDRNSIAIQESINARRDKDKEDAELRALLEATKKRLALAAEKAKTPEEKAAVKKKMENPYADLDVPEDQKQLLIAMAIAEEAAMSGKESFATVELKKEDLSRSIDSFQFLKNKDFKSQKP
mmetsp:Transcript_26762/g.37734  ORF Transcript_26762/g.37734 Transcript_26762/m.37734 type:complete len:371 (+) Transcript_26762:157-1269(+)